MSVVLCGAIVRSGGLPSIAALRPAPTIAAIALSLLVNNVLSALRWRAAVGSCGVQLPLRRALALWNGLLPLTFFPPLQSGSALAVVALRRVTGVGIARAALAVLYDKLLSLAGLGLLLAAGVAISAGVSPSLRRLGALGVVAVLLAGVTIARSPGLVARASRTSDAPALPRPEWARAVTLFVFAAALQTSEAALLALGFVAVGGGKVPWTSMPLYPAIQLAGHAPITVNGFGLREALVCAANGSLDTDHVAAASLFAGTMEFVLPAIAGAVFAPAAIRALWPRKGRAEEAGSARVPDVEPAEDVAP